MRGKSERKKKSKKKKKSGKKMGVLAYPVAPFLHTVGLLQILTNIVKIIKAGLVPARVQEGLD